MNDNDMDETSDGIKHRWDHTKRSASQTPPRGTTPTTWQDAGPEERKKAVQKAIMYLRSVARKKKTISYKRFVNFMNIAQAVHFSIHDFHDHEHRRVRDSILYRVSTEEDSQGHGMLSVVVVSSSEPRIPGNEFFKLAKKLGRPVSPGSAPSRLECFAKELEVVYAANKQPCVPSHWSGMTPATHPPSARP